MNTEKRTLLTVVTERVIETVLQDDFQRMGVPGYTITNARGYGHHGVREADWDEAANIRIEVVCARPQAERVLAYLQERYYADYAMVAWLYDVEVLRPERF